MCCARNWPASKSCVVIDFHTGLGESGAAEMIIEDAAGHARLMRAPGPSGATAVHSTADGGSLSAPLTGTIDAAMPAWMEGARPDLRRAGSRHAARARGVRCAAQGQLAASAMAGSIILTPMSSSRQIRAAFYPDTLEWKRSVWAHARARGGRGVGCDCLRRRNPASLPAWFIAIPFGGLSCVFRSLCAPHIVRGRLPCRNSCRQAPPPMAAAAEPSRPDAARRQSETRARHLQGTCRDPFGP